MNTSFLKTILVSVVVLNTSLHGLPSCKVETIVSTPSSIPSTEKAELWATPKGDEFISYKGGVQVGATTLKLTSAEEVLILPYLVKNELYLLTRTKRGLAIYELDITSAKLTPIASHTLTETIAGMKVTSPLVDALAVGPYVYLQTNFFIYRVTREQITEEISKWAKLQNCWNGHFLPDLRKQARPTQIHFYQNSILRSSYDPYMSALSNTDFNCAIDILKESSTLEMKYVTTPYSQTEMPRLNTARHNVLKDHQIRNESLDVRTYLPLYNHGFTSDRKISNISWVEIVADTPATTLEENFIRIKDIPVAASFWGPSDKLMSEGVYARSSGGIVLVQKGRAYCEYKSNTVISSVFLKSQQTGKLLGLRFLDSTGAIYSIVVSSQF